MSIIVFSYSLTNLNKEDFIFERVLGSGSYGVVHLARRQADGQLYAVKQINLRSMSRKEQLDAVNEVQVWIGRQKHFCLQGAVSHLARAPPQLGKASPP
jgi:serine/threonine protein kinase